MKFSFCNVTFCGERWTRHLSENKLFRQHSRLKTLNSTIFHSWPSSETSMLQTSTYYDWKHELDELCITSLNGLFRSLPRWTDEKKNSNVEKAIPALSKSDQTIKTFQMFREHTENFSNDFLSRYHECFFTLFSRVAGITACLYDFNCGRRNRRFSRRISIFGETFLTSKTPILLIVVIITLIFFISRNFSW